MTPGTIPPKQQAAAASFGKLVALRIVESKDAVESLYAAAMKAGYQGDEAGLRTRLWWIVRDTAEEWRITRIRSEYALRKHLAPMLDARAPSLEIWREAVAFADTAGEPFLRHEIRQIIEEEMHMRLAPSRTKRRTYGR